MKIRIILFCLGFYAVPLQSQCSFTVNAGPDITVCNPGDMSMLNGKVTGNPSQIEWEPTLGLANPKSPVTKVTVPGNMEYILIAKGLDPRNLILNGDFEGGRAGFTTDYTLGTFSCYGLGNLDCEGTYDVITNPQSGHSGFAPCTDHTSGSGKMMVLNGSANFQNIWCQTVPVIPDMDYTFTAWVTSVVSASPPVLQFSINGSSIGPTFNSSGNVCRWEKYETNWNSGGVTSALLCILNENTDPGGNDFALDDLSLKKICEVRDTVEVKITEIVAEITEPELVTCKKPSLQLDGRGSTQGPGWTYKWTTFDGKITSGDNTLEPKIYGPGTYVLKVCSPLPNCCKEVSIKVDGNVTPPKIDLSTKDTLGCGKSAALIKLKSDNPDVGYEWSGPSGFTSIDRDPIVFEAGKYIVKVEDGYECISYDSITILEKADNPKIDISKNHIDCSADTAFLNVTSSVPGSTFEWKGPTGQNNQGAQWAVVDSGKYVVTTRSPSGCVRTDTILITKNISKPNLIIQFDTINCKKDSAVIRVQTDLPLKEIKWSGSGTFQLIDSLNISTKNSGIYTLKVKAENGCEIYKDINILQDTAKPNLTGTTDTLTCSKQNVNIEVHSRDTLAQIYWTGPNSSMGNSQSISTDIAGTYFFHSVSLNFCEDSLALTVIIDTLYPEFQLLSDTLNCNRPSLPLSAIGDTTNVLYYWIQPNGLKKYSSELTVNSAGIYYFEAQYSNGCLFIDSVDVFADFEKPILTSKNDTLNCTKDSILLKGTALSNYTLLSWKDINGLIAGTGEAFVKQEGEYTLIGINPNGCSDSIKINVFKDTRKPDIFVKRDTLNCFKNQIKLIAISLRDSLTYQWSGPNGFSASTEEIDVDQAGKYKVIITTFDFCKSEFEVTISVDTVKPSITVINDTLNCKNRSVNLRWSSNGSPYTVAWTGPNQFTSNLNFPLISEGGRYSLLATGENGCYAIFPVDIFQDTTAPYIIVYDDTINCRKKIAQIHILSNANSIQWTSPKGTTFQLDSIVSSEPGNYLVEATSKNYCQSTATVTIRIDTLHPFTTIQFNAIDCRFTESTIQTDTLRNQEKISWMGPNGFSSVNTQFRTKVSGNYTLQLEGKNGCFSLYNLYIPIDTIAPLISASSDTINCKRKEATLQVFGNTAGNIIEWKDAAGNLISQSVQHKVTQAGMYLLSVINPANGCESVKTISVIKDTGLISDVQFSTNQPICGNVIGDIHDITIYGGHGQFEYSIDNKINWSRNTFFPNIPEGNYILYVKDSEECEFEKNFEIKSLPYIETQLVPELTIDLGDSIQLKLSTNFTANAIRSIDWSPKKYLSCTDCLQPFSNTTEDIEYEVTVTDTNGCKARQKIIIKVEIPEVWVPNVFSPNGDNLNDRIWVYGSKDNQPDILQFSIFDRWGEMVYSDSHFKPNDSSRSWNGTYKSRSCLPGVYVYMAEVKLQNKKTYWIKGDITLLR